jgi:hypothetical protein
VSLDPSLPGLLARAALVWHSDPTQAASLLEQAAGWLLVAAARLRHTPAQESPYQSEGGMSDRVQCAVVGPDGVVKHRTDTGAGS